MALTPTQRTLRHLKDQGMVCAIVEKWNPRGFRQDLFGVIDIIALDPVQGVVGVQSTGQDFSGHLKKILEEKAQETYDWLKTPGTAFYLYGWRKVSKVRGGKVKIWAPRIRQITLEDLEVPYADHPR